MGKYTNPRLLLKPNEVDMFDLMLASSRLLQETADGGIKELNELIVEDVADRTELERSREGLHRMLCYAFTCGVAMVIDQQATATAAAMAKQQRKN